MIGISAPPLEGVRILAVEQYGAGPFATMYLADMGADVIKIESPPGADGAGGDSSRHAGPHFLGDNDSHFFQTFNLGKRSLTLDMRQDAGRAIFERLVAGADAVMNNLRGDLPAKLGLTYDVLGKIKPSIVCAHLSGYGRTGDRASWPAYDYLLQAEAGFLSVTGEPDGPPTRMGLSVVDYLTGITTAFAMTAALFGAARTGKGRDVDVTLYDVAMHQLTYPATWYLNTGDVVERRPRSGHPSAVPSEIFPTRDGHIFVMCILPKFWRALCDVVGLPDLPSDARFGKPADRLANRDALAAILDEKFASRPTAEWMSLLAGKVPVAPVLSLPQALDNPFLAARDGIQGVEHAALPGMRVLSNPIAVDGNRVAARVAPALGQHTEELLAECGYGPDDVARLRSGGVV